MTTVKLSESYFVASHFQVGGDAAAAAVDGEDVVAGPCEMKKSRRLMIDLIDPMKE